MGAVADDFGGALTRAYRELVALAVGIAEAALVALLAIVVARFLRRRVLAGLRRGRIDANVATLAANAVLVGVYALAGAIALSLLGGTWSAIVTVLGAGTVAVSLALQDVLRGFVAGVYLLVERPFVIGDRIEVKGVEGDVASIDLRTTTLRPEAAGLVYVPNATIFSEVVRNRSAAGAFASTVTLTGVGGDPATIPGALADALATLDGLAGAPRIGRFATGPAGAVASFSIPHERGRDLGPDIAGRLRAAFPDATVAVERAPS